MKKTSKLVALILAGLMLCSTFVACGDDDKEAETTSSDGGPGATETTSPVGDMTAPETEAGIDTVQVAIDALKETVDWGGKTFYIMYASEVDGYNEELENYHEIAGVVSEGVYKRNTLLEEYAKLKLYVAPCTMGNLGDILKSEAAYSYGEVQLISTTMGATSSYAARGLLYDYMKLDIDYEQPCWDKGTLNHALDGKVFFMNGAFNFTDDDATSVMMFNKSMGGHYGMEDLYNIALYKIVKDKKWTIDKFAALASGYSADNGNGNWDEKDTYGFACTDTIGTTFFYGAGLKHIENTPEMVEPMLVLTGAEMEKAVDVMNKLRAILYTNHTSYLAENNEEEKARSVFVGGRSLFFADTASYLRTLQSTMTDDFGILPIPKYSESQDNYYTWSGPIGSTLSIPAFVDKVYDDMENFAGVVELYALLSEQYVRPAYYKRLLTTRGVYDVQSAEMADLIFPNRIYDMAMIYDASFFLVNTFKTAVLSANAPDFPAQYTPKSHSFDRTVSKILRNLRES